MAPRLKQSKDLGEIMVVAHAVVAAEASTAATVLIDDGAGARTVLLQAPELRHTDLLG
ncbi:hypothetical protein [Actinocrinis sp.]|uniref:hypothetical protein n=1 Tax=Actinocrinis sp. TaxID=1920516 RepID=UPI002D388A1B|nr:hypothetical protein [Actinocrinis sp.]HZP51786.1 hypothetical protein [Actinocrinis sp.]